MPLRALDFKTLVDLLGNCSFIVPPKVFGCVSFVHEHRKDISKLYSRALKYIFIRYSATQKGYKCHHPPTRKTYVSMYVTFRESDAYFSLPSLQGESNCEEELTHRGQGEWISFLELTYGGQGERISFVEEGNTEKENEEIVNKESVLEVENGNDGEKGKTLNGIKGLIRLANDDLLTYSLRKHKVTTIKNALPSQESIPNSVPKLAQAPLNCKSSNHTPSNLPCDTPIIDDINLLVATRKEF
ncbi:Retrovirus-related Pol polyprotein from transposon TNT 1-94 [Quillaja saponaria]|uniref:Retrovirus-related Pol polyprotein from transposon TNT 1-94 n=1 Tax=Quillaja saponaria TaxID=32244 RepID=A0AAD7VP05_QUISA|nr:Retrovirus-related Pol polyprotein from transposon TNT 1-94 [Quillaja saponaria]